jgi:peptidoglycan hydrolase CwlO-like protein
VTDQLVDDEVECWGCGRTVQRDQIESIIKQRRERVQECHGTVSDIEAEIDNLREPGEELQSVQERRESIEQRLRSIKTAGSVIQRLQEQRDDLVIAIKGQRDRA